MESVSSYRRHVALLMMLPLVMIFEFSCWLTPVLNSKLPQTAAAAAPSFNGCRFSEADCLALNSLTLDGHLSFRHTSLGAEDFGRMISHPPAAILYPRSVADIAAVVRVVHGSKSSITVAAKGPGHSVNGQGQAPNGIVIEMAALKGIRVNALDNYVDATGGELWVNVLEASLEEGLSPRSFTDYLYLSIGGTLSNGGISGQSFRHGPQISNVLQLEVVTGTGQIKVCSARRNSDLYFAVLGGLGQFGIITKARIILQPAPQKVRWIRALYSDFEAFTRDQLFLISQRSNQSSSASFDYVEGFVVHNSLHSQLEWKSALFQSESIVNTSLIPPYSASPVLYYIELTKNYDVTESKESVDEKVMDLLAPLSYISSFLYSTDVTYYDFLDRVHKTEMALKARGEWDVPHPWINVMIPQSKIVEFDNYVFRQLLRTGITGPVLCYPHNKEKWDSRTSAVVPEEEVFYVVALLQSALPDSGPSLMTLMKRNEMILDYCETLGCKQYLPRYTELSDWERHFGDGWTKFLTNKIRFDPQGILAPGQNIFPRGGLVPRPSALAAAGRQRV
ncbi:hypothetical protein R1flu_016120 [Riccia fluitans]|uniref:cytokinin dehydrogenase n=1 Tax=Riccia fluitans TaxID=41844 RepID=A0ABD1YP23_9MARC